jgi:hypothetical protein
LKMVWIRPPKVMRALESGVARVKPCPAAGRAVTAVTESRRAHVTARLREEKAGIGAWLLG